MTLAAISDLDLGAAADAVRRRQVSAVELVEAALARIAEVEPAINSFISVDPDGALAQARERDAQRDARGPLHGVPVAVKDNLATAGSPTTAGSAVLADHVPAEDAAAVAALRSAGAVVVGKTNLHELGCGVTGDNPHYGPVRNPWDVARGAAGSSGGSAAAVAARAVPAALGTDTGGSIVLPAATCGVTGLRPTIGAVSTCGAVPLAWSLDTVGPIARSATDCRLLLDVLTGGDAGEPADAPGAAVAVPRGPALERLQPAVRAAVADAVAVLADGGVRVKEVELEDPDAVRVTWLAVMLAEASAFHADGLRARPERYGDDVRALLELGAELRAVDYVQAQRARALVREDVLAALGGVDALLLPAVPITAAPVGARHVELGDGESADLIATLTRFAYLPGAAGLPALALPCGFDDDGLPIGVQLVGHPRGERRLCALAAAYQRATDWHLRRPPCATR